MQSEVDKSKNEGSTMSNDRVTKAETEKLKAIMLRLEAEAYAPYSKLCGGFAKATLCDWDDEYFDVQLKHGIKDGDENRVVTERIKVFRNTMEIVPPNLELSV
jgi:hypothetical protein